MKHLTILSVLCGLALGSSGATRTELLREKLMSGDRDYVFVACHQGDHRRSPGNTMGSITGAIELDADVIELDVQMTKDGKFFLRHNHWFGEGSNKVMVVDMTMDEVRTRFAAEAGGKPKHALVTLEEALSATRGKALVNIDKFTAHPHEILDEVKRLGCLREVLVKSDHTPDEARRFFGEYWADVERGEILYMPMLQFCWGRSKHAAKIMPLWLATEPRKASMYEVCFTTEADFANLDVLKAAKGSPRIWVNTMWNNLWPGRGEAEHRPIDPEFVWGKALAVGATMIQVDNPHLLIPYLERLGRHTLGGVK